MKEELAEFAVQEFPDRFQWEKPPCTWLIDSPRHDGTDAGSLLNHLSGSVIPDTIKVWHRDHDIYAPRIDVNTLSYSWQVVIYPYGCYRRAVLGSRQEIACVQLMGVALTLFNDGTYCFEDTSGG